MRVMLDTNILVSMIFFPSAQTRRFATELSIHHRIILCDYVITELQLVTERKFPDLMPALDRFFQELPYELVYTPKNAENPNIPEIRDEKDSPILTTAIMEDVDVFLTGDKDFLVLEIEHPEIMTMTQFKEEYHAPCTEAEAPEGFYRSDEGKARQPETGADPGKAAAGKRDARSG